MVGFSLFSEVFDYGVDGEVGLAVLVEVMFEVVDFGEFGWVGNTHEIAGVGRSGVEWLDFDEFLPES